MPRPRKKLPPDGLKIIRECAANGISEVELAKRLGMGFRAWQRIRDNEPEAQGAWAEAKADEHAKLRSRALNIAMDDNHPQHATLTMFLLKSRHGYRDHGADPADQRPAVNVSFTLPAAMSQADYMKSIKVEQGAIPDDRE